MKKYIKPVMEVYETRAEEMICASKLTGGGSQSNVVAEAPYLFFDEDEDDDIDWLLIF